VNREEIALNKAFALPAAAEEAPSLEELAAELTARGLSRLKLPERLELVDDFPRTASGKILKRTLRDRFARP